MAITRILHLSDLHFIPPRDALQWGDFAWFKRFAGAANFVLRRWWVLRTAAHKIATLPRFLEQTGAEAVVITGDLTVLGTPGEMQHARRLLGPLFAARPGRVMVTAGNHDLYVGDLANQAFFLDFGDLLTTDRPDLAGHPPGTAPAAATTAPETGQPCPAAGRWPLVRLLGAHAAVVVLQSSLPHRAFWRADGRIGETQLAALARILSDPGLADRTLLIALHHAPWVRDWLDPFNSHGLADTAQLAAVFAAHRDRPAPIAMLHGHVHRRMHLPRIDGQPATFCAGSSTFNHREGLWLFEIEADQRRAIPGTWTEGEYRLCPGETVIWR